MCTISRHLTFDSFLKHGRSNADLASAIAFNCSLTLLAIFTLVLPAIKKMPALFWPAIEKILERVKSASQADHKKDDGRWTVPWRGRHASSSVLSLPASPLRSSFPQSITPPPRSARPLSPCLLAPLPPLQMRPHSDTERTRPYGGWEHHSVSASTTMVSLCEM